MVTKKINPPKCCKRKYDYEDNFEDNGHNDATKGE